jgi:hypothetical protein
MMSAGTKSIGSVLDGLYEAHLGLQEMNVDGAVIVVMLPSVGTFCSVFRALREEGVPEALRDGPTDADLRHGVELFGGGARIALDPKVLREMEAR